MAPDRSRRASGASHAADVSASIEMYGAGWRCVSLVAKHKMSLVSPKACHP